MRISDWSSDVCSSDLDPEFEVETPFRVAGVVQDHRLEHGRVGNAQMIAFKRHQNGRTAGEPHDTTFMTFDHDMVIRAKWLAKAEHETRSEEHTSELQSLMRTSYAVFCLKKKKQESIK